MWLCTVISYTKRGKSLPQRISASVERLRLTFMPNGKRQIHVKNFSELKISRLKKCPEQFLCIKLACNYLFCSWSNKHLSTIKGNTWSRGTDSRLPFVVNVNLNLPSLHAYAVLSPVNTAKVIKGGLEPNAIVRGLAKNGRKCPRTLRNSPH